MGVNSIEPVDAEKVAEENPQSRFRILNAPIHKPGVCALCGSAGGDGRQFVDFGKTMEWYGVVYFCTFCIMEAAQLIGMAHASIWRDAENSLQREIRKVDDLYVTAKRDLDAARLLLRNCHCDDPDSVSDNSVPDAVVVEGSEESEGDSDDDSESPSVEGSGDVSETPVDESSNDESGSKPKRTRRSSSSSG